jgi:DNA-binding beta-propeller fold protein YncE
MKKENVSGTRGGIMALLVLAIALMNVSSAFAKGPPPPPPPDGGTKAPEEIMRANCGSCHGQLGEGGTSWITGRNAFTIGGTSTKRIKKWVRRGRAPDMPAFPYQEISNSELDDLATYISGLPDSYILEPDYAATVTITDENPWYNPMQVRVEVGETVQFTNAGSTWHPSTQIEFVASSGTDGTDSGVMGPGGAYYRTFNEAGKVTFLCKIHPYMRGEIYVGQDPVPPNHLPDTPLPLPTVAGTGEIWVEAQFQDSDGKEKDGIVQVIDAATWDITHMIPAGNNPHNIWATAGTQEVVLTNWFDNVLTRIDADTKEVIGDVVGGVANAHITSDFEGDEFFVSIEGSNYVQALRQRNYRRSGTGTVSGYGPHGIWYGGGIIMTSNSLDNTASFLDARSLSELGTLDAGLYPLGAGITTDGSKGYTGNCLDGTVSVFDVNAMVKIKDIDIGGCPVQAPITPDDMYVVVPNGPYTTVIEVATDEVLAQFYTGKGAHGATFSRKSDDSGWLAYVTNKFADHISVIDLSDMTHAGDVPLELTTEDNQTIFGLANTGGQGIMANPLPAPWQ